MRSISIGLPLALLSLAGCGGGGNGGGGVADIPVVIPFDAANFSGNAIDNVFLPLVPGTRLLYESEDGVEEIVYEVTYATKVILGVTCVEVRDRVFEDGELVEDTLDWFAQDDDGNVWYFGEDSKDIEDGMVVSTEGSWEAGVDGAQPGIAMLADPDVGETYAQEDAPGVAEDQGRVVGLGESVTVPAGSFSGCLHTEDFTPLEPGNVEDKFYAPGVGVVLEVSPEGDRVELVDIESF